MINVIKSRMGDEYFRARLYALVWMFLSGIFMSRGIIWVGVLYAAWSIGLFVYGEQGAYFDNLTK